MDAPLFSIIVPTFNVADTLPACLDSIARQTCSDFDLVVVDGGSTDRTLEIADSYSARLSGRLIIHSGPDRGPYDAMNHGVELASGAWLFFLGADDTLYADDTLTRVATFIREHDPSDIVYGDVMLRSKSSRYAGAFDLDRLLFEQNICHQAIFYRRELFAGIGPYNLRYRVWADWDFNIRCFSNPAVVARYMDMTIANYNDVSGVSKKEDEELKKRLPVFINVSVSEMFRRELSVWRKLIRMRRNRDH
ncbi:glycosyltransferase family 2 protein [Mycobacterium sp. E787]|uniref:glycosyltransferase family 2 protein n=1 Tax=Mycobacterium sp. E787 TaxID=1834150 RepID=UPI00080051C1|nr:glycosyltransferase family 2 protein [Mycobacterium sp. E787]OBI56055.1 glycosyltransferase [Mycobacterium sp. E787]